MELFGSDTGIGRVLGGPTGFAVFGVQIAWWMVIWAVVAVIIWVVVYVLNKNDHNGHKKRCKRLESRIRTLRHTVRDHEARLAEPSSPKP